MSTGRVGADEKLLDGLIFFKRADKSSRFKFTDGDDGASGNSSNSNVGASGNTRLSESIGGASGNANESSPSVFVGACGYDATYALGTSGNSSSE